MLLTPHPDEIPSDAGLVRRLVTRQFPDLGGLPVARLAAGGTDNALYRLGDALVARLPRRPGAAAQVEKQWRWLPLLAPGLPQPIPIPVALGASEPDFTWPWLLCRWIEGAPLGAGTTDDVQLAVDLARFVVALRNLPVGAGPPPGGHNFGRGVALKARDAATSAAIEALAGVVDQSAVMAGWRRDCDTAPAAGLAWLHGDLAAGNLLVRDGRLAAVIDFGGLAVGDAACDLMPAWTMFKGEARAAFRRATGAGDAEWARGRGWALSVALIQLPYYRTRDAALTAAALATVDAVLSDHARL